MSCHWSLSLQFYFFFFWKPHMWVFLFGVWFVLWSGVCFFVVLICWKSEPLKHLVNGRNGIGPGGAGQGVMEEIKVNTWAQVAAGSKGAGGTLQQSWLLSLRRVPQEHNTSIKTPKTKQNKNQKWSATSPTCKQGRTFHRFNVQGK